MAKDKDYVSMIHKNRWLRLRKAKLTSDPLCERCKENGITKEATEVHHVTPVEDGLTQREKETLMYDIHNLRSLCHDCHVLTHTEMGRSGKVHAKRRASEQLARFVKKFSVCLILLKMLKGAVIF